MTRKEEIKKEAFEYADKELIGIIDFKKEEAFIEGAMWADNSLLEKIRQVDLSTTGRLHNIWHGMKQRCTNPKASGYEYYGAKGIAVCDEWQTFVGFAVWALINGYSNELSIDRINTKGNYNPSNCRWADARTQANNTSRNHYIEGKTIAQHAKENDSTSDKSSQVEKGGEQ